MGVIVKMIVVFRGTIVFFIMKVYEKRKTWHYLCTWSETLNVGLTIFHVYFVKGSLNVKTRRRFLLRDRKPIPRAPGHYIVRSLRWLTIHIRFRSNRVKNSINIHRKILNFGLFLISTHHYYWNSIKLITSVFFCSNQEETQEQKKRILLVKYCRPIIQVRLACNFLFFFTRFLFF